VTSTSVDPLAGVRVGLDLDGVCSDYVASLAEFLLRSGRTGPLPRPVDFRLAEWFESDEARVEAHRAAVASGLHRDAPPIEGAVAGIAELRRRGALAIAVSARGSYREDERETRRDIAIWARRNNVVFDGVHLGRPKAAAGCAIYLDDSPDDIADLRIAGALAVVFDQPWNRDLLPPRAEGWADVPVRLVTTLKAAAA
jgi:beta-phosphoglucomutase-like phosphatase (HAD superfamily)